MPIIYALVGIAIYQLITFIIFFVTNENQDILVYMACGGWLVAWNKTVLTIEKIWKRIKRKGRHEK